MKKKSKTGIFVLTKLPRMLLIMKSIVILLFCTLNLQAAVYSQHQKKFDISLNNVTVSDVFRYLHEVSQYDFVYDSDAVKQMQPVSLDLQNTDIESVLNTVLAGTPFGWSIEDNVIIIRRNEQPTPSAQQQSKVLKGKVTDKQGNTLPGVTILIKGTTIGNITDANGEFNFEIPDMGNIVLVFSFVGMKSQEVSVGNTRVFEIVMESDIKDLEEVMITGYQTISKERATGAYDIVPKKHLQSPSSNIAQRLVGMVAGLQLLPGTEDSFEIRGKTSLGANNTPLLVVDGFPIEGGFSTINPNDVESVTVLKDAAAASIWGARSANGVIVITTKSGGKFTTKGANIEVSAFAKVSPKIDIDYWRPLATSEETVEYEKMGFATNFWGNVYPVDNTERNVTSGNSQAIMALNEHRLGFLGENEMNDILNRLKTLDNREQIKKYVLDIPVTHQYNINISGNSERVSQVLSLMYEHQRGNMKGQKEDRLMANYRSDVKVFRWLDFHFGGIVQYHKDENSTASVAFLQPYDMLVDDSGNPLDLSYYNYYTPILKRFYPTDLFPYTDWSYNPLTDRDNTSIKSKSLNARIQGGLTFRLWEGLSFDTKFQYEIISDNNITLYNEKTNYVRDQINTTSFYDREANTVTPNLPLGGIRQESKSETTAYSLRNQLNFNRTFRERHAFNVIAGVEINERVVESTDYPTTYGYDDETLKVGVFPNGITNTKNWQGYTNSSSLFSYTSSFSSSTDRYFSAFANASYTLDDKYTLSGSVRSDASNLITDDPKYRYAPFWSIGAGWQIHKERFMEDLSWLDRLNIRTTYGYNGNVDKSTSFQPLIDLDAQQDEWLNDYVADISSYGNPTLRWEKTGTWNLGLDYSVFAGKLYGKIDVYHKRGKDLIAEISIPSVNGTTTQVMNAAKMTNNGIEFEIGTDLPIYGEKITWTGNFNFAYNKNKITNLEKDSFSAILMTRGNTYAYVEGYNANAIWSFEYVGVRNHGTEDSPDWQPCVMGEEGEVSLSSNSIGGNARSFMLYSGTKIAPYNIGFSNSFKIYDFNLSFLLTGKFGHHFRRTGFNYPTGGTLNKYYKEVINADPNECVPLPKDEEPNFWRWGNYLPYLDYLVESASHIRLQEITISYEMPVKLLSKIGFNALQVMIQGNNLATWLKNNYKEDPEYVLGSMKPRASYTFSLRFTF